MNSPPFSICSRIVTTYPSGPTQKAWGRLEALRTGGLCPCSSAMVRPATRISAERKRSVSSRPGCAGGIQHSTWHWHNAKRNSLRAGKTSLGAQCRRADRSTEYQCASPAASVECKFGDVPHARLMQSTCRFRAKDSLRVSEWSVLLLARSGREPQRQTVPRRQQPDAGWPWVAKELGFSRLGHGWLGHISVPQKLSIPIRETVEPTRQKLSLHHSQRQRHQKKAQVACHQDPFKPCCLALTLQGLGVPFTAPVHCARV